MYNPTSKPHVSYWWREPSPFHAIVQAIKWLDNDQQQVYDLNLRNLMLYGNRAAYGLNASDYTDRLQLPSSRLTLNVVQSVIDAAVSQIATIKPRIINLTDAGNWAQQQRARKLNQWTQGIFYETDAYKLGKMAFRDACIFGTGALKIIERDGRAALERVFIDDLIVDNRDARNGNPKQLFEVRELPRDVVAAAFPDYADEIASSGNSMRIHNSLESSVTDLVSVAEAWHLPSGPDADDGKHVICVDNCDLLVEDWTKPYFPYGFLRWGISPLGFWGWGIAEQLTGVQYEINFTLQKIQKLMTLATSQLWIRKGSGINKNKMTNDDFAVMEYTTEPPTVMNVAPVHPAYYGWLQQIYRHAFEITGVNQLTAQAEKPPGLNSGKALDTYQDVQSQRFMEVTQQYEQFFVEIANKLADKTAEIADREGTYAVKARSRKGFELLDWSEVRVDRDDYITQPYPTNFFPQTPAGKWNQIQQMLAAQFLTPEEASELLDYPDLESITKLKNAPMEYVQKVIQTIVEDGEQTRPEAYSPLGLLMQMLPLEVLRAEQDGVPEERIDALRDYINEVQRLMQMAMPPEPTQPQLPAQLPQDMQAQTPPDLLPQAGGLPPAPPQGLPVMA